MTKQQASDYKEFLGRMARYFLLGVIGLVLIGVIYLWGLYSIALKGVDQRIKEDRQNVPENIGG